MPKVKVRPLAENVLIQPLKADKKTDTGIFLPENASKDAPQEGKVVALGEGKEIKVKKGQIVIFRPYSGIEVKVEGEDQLIIKNEDILAIIE